MGRPLNKKYFGNRNIGSTSTTADNGIVGKGVASVTLAANNSTAYTNGAAVTFSAPSLANGVTATGTIVTHSTGGLTTKTTYGTLTGTAITSAATYGTTSAPLASTATSGTGAGATFIVTKTAGTNYNTTATITLVDPGAGYALTNTVKILGSALGGVDVTNDLVLTITTFVATTGTIRSITITDPGSGYVTAPTVTLPSGTPGTLTTTAVLTTAAANTNPAGSAANPDAGIIAYAYIGGSLVQVDIVKQVQTDRYRVNSSSTGSTLATSVYAKLKTTTASGSWPNSEGVEMNIVAKDSAGGTYLVRKLTAHKAVIVPAAVTRLSSSAGTQFPLNADGSAPQIAWTFDTPTANVNVQIENA